MKIGNKGRTEGIMALIVLAMLISIGLIAVSKIDTTTEGMYPSNYSASNANDKGAIDAHNNLSRSSYDAFQLTSVSPTIMGAVLILGLVGLLMSRRK